MFTYSDIDIITPTANRPQALLVADKQLCRMEGSGEFRWIISNGSEKPLPEFKYPNTVILNNKLTRKGNLNFLNNVEQAVKAATGELVVVMEDDDWYRKDYLTNKLGMFNSTDKRLIGLDNPRHYHLGMRCLEQRYSGRVLSLMHATSFRRSLTPYVLSRIDDCRERKSHDLDWSLWDNTDDKQLFPRGDMMTSLKGWLDGLTDHHKFNTSNKRCWTHHDPDLEYLEWLMGGEYLWYEPWWRNYVVPKFARSMPKASVFISDADKASRQAEITAQLKADPIMLVIATNNDTTSLQTTLTHIRKNTEPGTYKICLEDTGSTRQEHIEYIKSVADEVDHVHFHKGSVYEAGGYLHAINTYDSPGGFVLMQDTVYPKRPDWLYKVSRNEVSALFKHPMHTEWDLNEDFCREHLGGLPKVLPKHLFQHNTLYIRQDTARRLIAEMDPPVPSLKEHAQGYERIWPFYFDKLGVPFKFMDNSFFYKIPPKDRPLRPK